MLFREMVTRSSGYPSLYTTASVSVIDLTRRAVVSFWRLKALTTLESGGRVSVTKSPGWMFPVDFRTTKMHCSERRLLSWVVCTVTIRLSGVSSLRTVS